MKQFFHLLPLARRDAVMSAVMAGLCLLLVWIDIFPAAGKSGGSKEKAEVLEVDNSRVLKYGVADIGTQTLKVKILSGARRGQIFDAANELRGQMELDKLFAAGDIALVAVTDDAVPGRAVLNAQDHYRIGYTLLLFVLFAVLLIVFGGFTGFNALLSFIFSFLAIWKIVVPLCLKGYSALWVTFTAVTILAAVIIFLVGGLNRKGLTAFAGTIAGVLASCLMALIFTGLFRINGAVMPYAQALYNSGYEFIVLPEIYIGAIFLSSSGAVMDLAMDVASAMDELSIKRPELERRELLLSGLRIGRNVVGTMTTTLLLAYVGGYLTLMMTFAANGVEPIDFINNPYVASEAVKTLVGSFGLVLVAPFTAAAGMLLLKKR